MRLYALSVDGSDQNEVSAPPAPRPHAGRQRAPSSKRQRHKGDNADERTTVDVVKHVNLLFGNVF